MTSEKIRILIVDDEEDLLEILSFNLSAEGYMVDTVTSAEEAMRKNLPYYDLFILDVMMGSMSGFRLAEKIKKEMKLTAPIIFLTARDTENDKITGFNLGADDYLAKPFSIRELTARVKAVLRRFESPQKGNEISFGDFRIDFENKMIYTDDTLLELTRKEYEILSLLLRNPGKIYSRNDVLSKIWGDDVIVTDRTVDVTIARIRKKMGEKGSIIRNKSGYGYYLSD